MKLALIGAGEKWACASCGQPHRYAIRCDRARGAFPAGAKPRLKEATGLNCVPLNEALSGAEVVVLAVPDTAIGPALDRSSTSSSPARSS